MVAWLGPFAPSDLACQSVPPPAEPAAYPSDHGSLQVAKQTHGVKPQYPELVRRQRITGTVILESLRASTGCFKSVQVVKSAIRSWTWRH